MNTARTLALLSRRGGGGGSSVGTNPFNVALWMEPASGAVQTLSYGEFSDAVVTGSPTLVSGVKTYHAGSVNGAAFNGSQRIRYPAVNMDDITSGIWVCGLIRAASYSNDTLISTGGSSAGEAGWNLRMNSAGAAFDFSDGTTRGSDTTPVVTLPVNEWVQFLWQWRWTSPTAGESIMRINGYGSTPRAKTGMPDMTGIASAFGGTILGATNLSNNLPFEGDMCVQAGFLNSNQFLDLDEEYFLCNYLRTRLYSDAQNYSLKNKIDLLRTGPVPNGLVTTVYTNTPLRMRVYDEATHTIQHTSARITPTNGVAKFVVTSGLTPDTEHICEFDDASGNIQGREVHVKTWPAVNSNVNIQSMSCNKWAEHSGPVRGVLYASAKIGSMSTRTRPHLCIFPEDEGYRDPGVQSPPVSDLASFLARDLECHHSYSSWWYLDHVPLLFGCGNHDVEDGVSEPYDKNAPLIGLVEQFAHLVMPIQDSDWGHATDGWYYSVSLGDFRVISMDVLSTKTLATEMIDSTQKDWWKTQVATAAAANQVVLNNWAFVVKFGSVPLTDKHWNYYSAQITELFDFLKALFGSSENHFLSFQGDVHLSGLDSGANQGNLDTGGLMRVPCVHASRYAHPTANSLANMVLDLYENNDNERYAVLSFVDGTTTTALTADFYTYNTKDNGTSLIKTFTKAASVPAPTISDQPDNVSATPGQNVSFTVAATSVLDPTYQWEVDTGGGYSDVLGATSATLTLNDIALSEDGDVYRCKVTNPGGTTTTNAATLSVTAFLDPTDFVNLLNFNLDGGLAYHTSLVSAAGTNKPVLRDLDADYTYPVIVKTPCLDLVSDNSDYIDLGAGIRSIVSEANNFSFAIEFAKDNNSYATFVSINTGVNDRFTIEIGSGDVRAHVYDGAHRTKSISATLTNGDFHRIVCTYDTSTNAFRMWLDGTEAAGTSNPSSAGVAASFIGRFPGGANYFDGKVMSVRAWSSVLGATEAQDISNGIAQTTAPAIWYAFQEGSGNTIYNVIANASHATNIGGDWVLGTGNVRDHSILYGGKMSSGVFIPGLTSGASCANGDALVLAAGKFGNTNSQINFNPNSNATLTALGYETAYVVGAARQSVGTTDTKFRRTDTDGDDRFFGLSSALTGQAKTDAETYVAETL